MPDKFDQTRDDISVGPGDIIAPEDFVPKQISGGAIPYPRLEVIAGPEEGRAIALNQGEQFIGRSREKANIYLDDSLLSRLHAKLLGDKSAWSLTDLGSLNGTFVNGKKIETRVEIPLKHLDEFKVGLYTFRFALKEYTENDLKPPKPQDKNQEVKKTSDEKKASAVAPQEKIQEPKEVSHLPVNDSSQALVAFPSHPEAKVGSRLTYVFLIICLLSALGGLSYFLYHRYGDYLFGKDNPPDVQEEEIVEPEIDNPPEIPVENPPEEEFPPIEPPPIEIPPQQKENVTDNKLPSFHAFLDVKTQPTRARIFFEGKDLGMSPLKIPVELEPEKEYVVIAEYDLSDINDRYQQKINFKADLRKEVVDLLFEAELGVIKVNRLPPHVNFYLEGYYSYDKLKSHPVRLKDLVYGKPLYVPYGHYVIELREKVKMENSQTYVDEIRYHREFDLNKERNLITLSIKDRDLKFFPAKIHSSPSGAKVYLDEEEVGTTPFEGELPLGQHQLKLVREGFFDYEAPLEMRTNTPYEATITLKTSKVGEYINKAKEYHKAGHYQEAIDELINALKIGGAPREKAEVHYLLGECYLSLQNYEKAKVYFEQAKSHQDFYYFGILGMAKTLQATGDTHTGLTYLVDVLVNTKGYGQEKILKEARGLFRELSPVKSVLYINTEPSGADVVVNNQRISNQTPIILSDLSLGHYRIELNKKGYQTLQIKKSLKLSDFVTIIVQLQPEEL